MLVITYTSTHNHPGPDFSLSPPTKLKQEDERESISLTHDRTHPTTPTKQEEEMPQETPAATNSEDTFQYSQSPFNSTPDHTIANQEETQTPFQQLDLETANVVVYSDDPKPFSDDSVELSPLKTEENDFYDELEELPTSSFFTAFMRSNFSEDRVAVKLS